jgi:hypothetical protein
MNLLDTHLHGPIYYTKPTRCTNFSNLFLEWNSTYFGQFLCPSSGVFHCTHSNGICHTGLLTACEQYQNGTSWSCLQAVSKTVWHIPLLCVQWKTPDDGQRKCPKYVEFHYKDKFEKSVHLVVFITRNLIGCTVTWSSNYMDIHFRCTFIYKPSYMYPKSIAQHISLTCSISK